MNDKMLIVFNTCGISRENTHAYVYHINKILEQATDKMHVAISSCLNGPLSRQIVRNRFGSSVSYNNIDDKLPVSVTFNDTVEQCVNHFGEFDGYMFIDSGIDVSRDPTGLQKLQDLYKTGKYTMIAARTDDDLGLDEWFGTDAKGDQLFENGDFVVPVGRAVNLHVQVFSTEMVRHFGRPLPDIFAGQCMESTFSFLCAAFRKKWVVSNTMFTHRTGMDGPSSGFSPAAWLQAGRPRWDHMFMTDESILDIIGRGTQYGMGYEENQSIVNHDASKYDEDGFAVCPELKDYIRDNLYLTKEQFDYSTINREFTP
jgi:hypothetical protein